MGEFGAKSATAGGPDGTGMIAFDGCRNFRDLGGYATASGSRVRTRGLFRSMTPEFMTERDLERARNQ